MPLLSLVVPAWNEEHQIPVLLDSIEIARRVYTDRHGDQDAIEVIVADNDSSDATRTIAEARGCHVIKVTKRAIAAARNGGAHAAQGQLLAFVDADSQVHPDCFWKIIETMRNEQIIGGATGVTMERWSTGIALTYAAMLPMVWVTGIDTGVVFMRRADFRALGGFDESKLVAEDVDFLLRLKRCGAARGQQLVRLRTTQTITSARKFDKFGDWHFFRKVPALFLRRMFNRKSFLEAVRKYWYER